ncbi:eukaryotic translation initiation factor 3 subunit H, partial [Clarias magur]
QYQMEMTRSLRHVSIDHLDIGRYQCTYYVRLLRQPSSAGLPVQLPARYRGVRGARLLLKKADIGYEHMFGEAPIVIKSSNLMNVLMWELEDKSTVAEKHKLLGLSSSNHLEKSLQLLMDRVDDTSQEIVKYNTYRRNLSKQQQKHQYAVHIIYICLGTFTPRGQINNYCQDVKELFMAEALQQQHSG